MKAFTTTIKSVFIRMKEEDHTNQGFFDEYKLDNDYWNKRLKGVRKGSKANFLEGNKPHVYKVVKVFKIPFMLIPEKYREAYEGPGPSGLMNVIRCT